MKHERDSSIRNASSMRRSPGGSEVTAVVLTVGEQTTEHAVRSVRRQVLEPEQIVMVERDVTPFHKALNSGASRVRTEFFVQVDSDMILDPGCFSELKRYMGKHIGIVAGALRDPLLGRICCVKMFRTACFCEVNLRDSISPETEFVKEIAEHGWGIVYAGGPGAGGCDSFHVPFTDDYADTLGEHRPEYTPFYTFWKFLLMGTRYRYRRHLQAVKDCMARLHRSGDPVATIAQAAMAHGVFLNDDRDLLQPFAAHPDFELLREFMQRRERNGCKVADVEWSIPSEPKEVFKSSFHRGHDLGRRGSWSAFRAQLQLLGDSAWDLAWVAKIGLCHGIFSTRPTAEQISREARALEALIKER